MRVIITAPYWVSYPISCSCAEGKPVIVQADIAQVSSLTPKQLKRRSRQDQDGGHQQPSNPSGAVYTLDDLKALGEVLRKHPTSSSRPTICTSISRWPTTSSATS